MKRVGNLYSKMVDLDNLYLAYTKAKKGKHTNAEYRNFSKDFERNMNNLQVQFSTEKLEIGNYHYFTIHDPKTRQICAASFKERIIHHAIMNICHPYFEKNFIYHSYATRKNKGTYAALEHAQRFMRKNLFYAKLDVRKYFDSIDHGILKTGLLNLFKDKKLLCLFNQIIDSYHSTQNKGLPIGNLTSQYFANFYLSSADHYALHELKLKGYIRYMDDILLFANSREELISKTKVFSNFVSTTLRVNFKNLGFGNSHLGVNFLGYKVFPYEIILGQRAKKRFKSKLKLYSQKLEKKEWSEREYQNHILPLLAYVEYADSFNYRKKCIFEQG